MERRLAAPRVRSGVICTADAREPKAGHTRAAATRRIREVDLLVSCRSCSRPQVSGPGRRPFAVVRVGDRYQIQ